MSWVSKMKTVYLGKIDSKKRILVKNIFNQGDVVVIKKDQDGKIVLEKVLDGDDSILHVTVVEKDKRIVLNPRVMNELKATKGDFVLILKDDSGRLLLAKASITPEF